MADPNEDLDDMDWYDDVPNEVVPPFDLCKRVLVDEDLHDVHRLARRPDSSLDGLRPYTTPRQLEDIHLHFVGVWDKHHGF